MHYIKAINNNNDSDDGNDDDDDDNGHNYKTSNLNDDMDKNNIAAPHVWVYFSPSRNSEPSSLSRHCSTT